jgi:hypothetical protein
MSGTPPRHGPDWGRGQRTPAGGVQAGLPYASAFFGQMLPQAGAVPTNAVQAAGIFPVWQLNTIFDVLPDPATQLLALTQEVRWNAALVAAKQGTVLSTVVPQKYAYIITDIFYYALAPSSLLAGPPARLTAEQLAGLVHFELKLNNLAPMKDDTSLVNPYTTDDPATDSGWANLEQPYGPQRNGRFAVYARSGQKVEVLAMIDTEPRFMLSKLGAHIHGYSLPETTFAEIFRQPRL